MGLVEVVAFTHGTSSPFSGAGEGFFKAEHNTVLSSGVVGLSRVGGGMGFLMIVMVGWVCFSGGDVSWMVSSMPTGEAGETCFWVVLDVGISRALGFFNTVFLSFPRAVKPPSKRGLGRLRSARWALTFSSHGDRGVLRVLRRGRRAVDASAFATLVLTIKVLVWIAMGSNSND